MSVLDPSENLDNLITFLPISRLMLSTALSPIFSLWQKCAKITTI